MTNNLKSSSLSTGTTQLSGKFTKSSSTSGKTGGHSSGTGKQSRSRYAQKAKGNAKKSLVAAKPRGPVFNYTSVCCSAPAKKKPCVAVNKKEALTQTLGKFRCGACGKRCKVTVSKYKAPEPVKAVEYTAASIEVLKGMDPSTHDTPAFVPPAEVPLA